MGRKSVLKFFVSLSFMGRAKLPSDQVAAMKVGKRKSDEIAAEFPQIADDYRSGSTLDRIVKSYKFMERYSFGSFGSAYSAVYRALRRLIPEGELDEIGRLHRVKGGRTVYERGVGLYAVDKEIRRAASRRGGSIGGTRTYERGHGFFSVPEGEEPSERVKAVWQKAGKCGATARGHVIWSPEETTFVLELCRNPEYQYAAGPYEGCPNYRMIVQQIEEKFGVKRTVGSLHHVWNRRPK